MAKQTYETTLEYPNLPHENASAETSRPSQPPTVYASAVQNWESKETVLRNKKHVEEIKDARITKTSMNDGQTSTGLPEESVQPAPF